MRFDDTEWGCKSRKVALGALQPRKTEFSTQSISLLRPSGNWGLSVSWVVKTSRSGLVGFSIGCGSDLTVALRALR